MYGVSWGLLIQQGDITQCRAVLQEYYDQAKDTVSNARHDFHGLREDRNMPKP